MHFRRGIQEAKREPINKLDIMNATLKEEAKRNVHALHIQVVVWAIGKLKRRCRDFPNTDRHNRYHTRLQHRWWEEMSLDLRL